MRLSVFSRRSPFDLIFGEPISLQEQAPYRSIRSAASAGGVTDKADLSIECLGTQLVDHDLQDQLISTAARASTDQGKGDGVEPLLASNAHGASHALLDGELGRSPQHADAGHMDDPAERQTAGGGEHRTTERNGAELRKLTEWLNARPALDGTRNSLRNQKPPRQDVAVPRVDNCDNGLIKQVAFYDVEVHLRARKA